MPGLLADVNAEGYVDALVAACQSPGWNAVWTALHVRVSSIQALGLPKTTADDVLWRACQQNDLLLITANRNAKGPSSLVQTIARECTSASLPVLTLADGDRLIANRAYCEQAAERLIDILINLDSVRGSGRLWLP
jgi:hypothetical protein